MRPKIIVCAFALLIVAMISCGTSTNRAVTGPGGDGGTGAASSSGVGGMSTSSGQSADGSVSDGSSSGSEWDVIIPASDAGTIPASNRVEINMG
jgi:hypothetical protein